MSLDFSLTGDLIWTLFTIGIWVSIAFDVVEIIKIKRQNKKQEGKTTNRTLSLHSILNDDTIDDTEKVRLLRQLLEILDGE